MRYKVECVTTENEYTEAINQKLEEMSRDEWKLFTMTSVRSTYQGPNNNDYFDHFLVFVKEE